MRESNGQKRRQAKPTRAVWWNCREGAMSLSSQDREKEREIREGQ
jgi:hypothetical protein